MTKPPSVMPSAAAMAMRLDVFVSPPNMSISTFPDKLPKPNSRFELASRHRFGETPPVIGQKSPRKRVLKSGYTRSPRKVNCYQTGRSRFWPSCDISATKLEPSRQILGDGTVAESRASSILWTKYLAASFFPACAALHAPSSPHICWCWPINAQAERILRAAVDSPLAGSLLAVFPQPTWLAIALIPRDEDWPAAMRMGSSPRETMEGPRI